MAKKFIMECIEDYIIQKLNKDITIDDIVLWVGSTANGLSNAYSDIDLLLITANPYKKRYTAYDGEVNIISEIYNEMRYDVEIIDKMQLLQKIGKINTYQNNTNNFHDLFLSEHDLDLICNIIHATCLKNATEYKRIKNNISNSFLCACIKTRYQGRFYNELEDIRGFISQKKYYNIAYIIPRLIVSLLLVLLSHFDFAWIKEKWLLNYVEREISQSQFNINKVKELYSYHFDPNNPDLKKLNHFLSKITDLMNKFA